ncbi:transposase [Streptomyces sp900105245]|uniref:Transposase n=1 Tax=Streptomyces sp. 900105245 TaxID=3154379 RepID=A0ABV1ULW0_9ACTN
MRSLAQPSGSLACYEPSPVTRSATNSKKLIDPVCIRRDPQRVRAGDETVTNLKVLAGRRMDLVADHTRTVNRLRTQLTEIFTGR